MAVAGQDVRQLLLQVDASVALAQRNLNSLAQQVDRDTRAMNDNLRRPEDALDNLSRAFRNMDQVMVASANQRRAYGVAVDRVTAQEMRAVQAVQALAQATTRMNVPLQIATREQLQAAQAIGQFAAATRSAQGTMARGTASMGQMRAGAQQLSFQIGDVAQQFALGQRPMMIFAQQSGQIVQAIGMMRAGAGGFIGFMAGPWGAVLTGAVVLLGTFGAKLFDTTNELENAVEELEENARKADLAREAQAAFERTLPGVIARLREETEALRDQNRTLEENQQLMLDRARGAQRAVEAERAANVRAQAATLDDIARLERMVGSPGADPRQQDSLRQALAQRRADLEELRRQNAQLQAQIGETADAIRLAQGEIAAREAETLADPIARINAEYDRMADAARDAAAGNDALTRSLRDQLLTIERQRRAALEAERERSRRTRDPGETTQFQWPVQGRRTGTFGEQRGARRHAGYDLAVPVGTPVGAAAAGTVIEVGTLGDYGNVVIIDHGGGTVTRYAHLSRMTARRGQAVAAGEVIGLSGGARGAPGSGNSRGPHVHFEVRQGGRAVPWGQGRFRTDALAADEAAAEAAARAAEQEARRRAAFAADLARADEELLQARNELATSAQEQLTIALQRVEMDRQQRELAIAEGVRRGDLLAAEATQLRERNEAVAAQRRANLLAQEQERLGRARFDVSQEILRGEVEVAEMEGRLAETAREQRDTALRLLDLRQQLERQALDEVIKSRDATEAQREIARLQRSRLDTLRNLERAGIERQYEGPRARYIRELREGVANVDERLEQIEVDAMRNLTDETARAAREMLGLSGAVGEVVEQLIRLALERGILELLEALGVVTGGGGKGVSLGSGNAPWWNFGGGRASGGPVNPGTAYLVGEKGPEIIVPRAPSVVIPNHAIGRGGGRERVDVHVHLDSEMLQAEIAATSAGVVAQATPRLAAKEVEKSLARLFRPGLP